MFIIVDRPSCVELRRSGATCVLDINEREEFIHRCLEDTKFERTLRILEKMASELKFEPLVPGLCEECQDLLRHYYSGEVNKDSFLRTSIRNGHVDCVKACIAAGADVNVYKITDRFIKYDLLPEAVIDGYDDCVEVLIKAGAVVTYESLSKAAEHGSSKCVSLILEAGGDPNVMLRHLALQCADQPWLQERFKILIQAGADVNTPQGVEALMIASAKGLDKVVHALIDTGADVNKVFKRKSALSVAAMKGSSSCVDLLLKSGADVNFRDNKGRSPLHNAVNSTNVQFVKLLLEAGADVNSTDNEGNTVLFLSLIWFSVRRLNCYKLLLNAGVKVNIRNNHGFNALTRFLVNLADDEQYKRSRTAIDVKLEEEFVMLLFAAGEKVDETRVGKVPEYMKLSAEISLMNICRKFIRKHQLQMSDVNLIHKVVRLSLPRLMTSYLLYDVTVEPEEASEH